MAISPPLVTSVENHTAWPATLLPRPSGLASGDFMIAFLVVIGQPSITAEPSGWTQLGVQDTGANLRTAVYLRTASSSEPPSGYEWVWSQAFKNFGVLLAYRGVDEQPLASFGSSSSDPGTSHDTPLTFVPSGGWLLSLVGARHQGPRRTWTVTTGNNERYDDGSDATSGQNITGAVYDSGAPIVAAGDYQRTLVASDDVVLTAVWSLALRSPTPAGANLPWVVGVPVGQEGDPPEPGDDLDYVGQAQVINEASASPWTTVAVPAGVQVGDWMIAHIATVLADPAFDPPAGWTQVGSAHAAGNLSSGVWVRRAGSSEPDDYSWGHSSTRTTGRIVAYRGGPDTDIVADHAVAGTTTSTTTFGMPAVDVPEDGSLLYFTADRRNAPSVAQVWSTSDANDSKRGEITGVGAGFQASSAAFDSDRALAESTPARTVTAAETWGQVSVWALALRRAA